jgi:hypothetical protein
MVEADLTQDDLDVINRSAASKNRPYVLPPGTSAALLELLDLTEEFVGLMSPEVRRLKSAIKHINSLSGTSDSDSLRATYAAICKMPMLAPPHEQKETAEKFGQAIAAIMLINRFIVALNHAYVAMDLLEKSICDQVFPNTDNPELAFEVQLSSGRCVIVCNYGSPKRLAEISMSSSLEDLLRWRAVAP